MIKEQTIYVTEDLNRFDNYNNAKNHEEIYSRLTFDEEKWLGDRLIYPGIGGGYCLETRQHKQSDLIQVAMDIITLLNTHCIMNDDNYYNMDRWFNPCLKMITEIQSSNDIIEQSKLWNQLSDYIKRFAGSYFYKNEQEATNAKLSNCIVYQIALRLDNTSWKSGIEYPECHWTRPWRLREFEWDDFVEKEKKYIADGGKYR